MQNPMIENSVRFMHLEKLYGYLPGMDEELLARLFGLDLGEYRDMTSRGVLWRRPSSWCQHSSRWR
jgi:hypothetical protein